MIPIDNRKVLALFWLYTLLINYQTQIDYEKYLTTFCPCDTDYFM